MLPQTNSLSKPVYYRRHSVDLSRPLCPSSYPQGRSRHYSAPASSVSGVPVSRDGARQSPPSYESVILSGPELISPQLSFSNPTETFLSHTMRHPRRPLPLPPGSAQANLPGITNPSSREACSSFSGTTRRPSLLRAGSSTLVTLFNSLAESLFQEQPIHKLKKPRPRNNSALKGNEPTKTSVQVVLAQKVPPEECLVGTKHIETRPPLSTHNRYKYQKHAFKNDSPRRRDHLHYIFNDVVHGNQFPGFLPERKHIQTQLVEDNLLELSQPPHGYQNFGSSPEHKTIQSELIDHNLRSVHDVSQNHRSLGFEPHFKSIQTELIEDNLMKPACYKARRN